MAVARVDSGRKMRSTTATSVDELRDGSRDCHLSAVEEDRRER
jgi:hypothetical protein